MATIGTRRFRSGLRTRGMTRVASKPSMTRHLQVHQHEVERSRLEGADGVLAVGHGDDTEPQLLEQARGDHLVGGVVFGQQNACAAASDSARSWRTRGSWTGDRASSASCLQQRDQAVEQLRLPDRLGEAGREPSRGEALGVARLAERGQHDQRVSFSSDSLLMLAAQRLPVDIGHLHVRDDERRTGRLRPGDAQHLHGLRRTVRRRLDVRPTPSAARAARTGSWRCRRR